MALGTYHSSSKKKKKKNVHPLYLVCNDAFVECLAYYRVTRRRLRVPAATTMAKLDNLHGAAQRNPIHSKPGVSAAATASSAQRTSVHGACVVWCGRQARLSSRHFAGGSFSSVFSLYFYFCLIVGAVGSVSFYYFPAPSPAPCLATEERVFSAPRLENQTKNWRQTGWREGEE